MPDANPFVKQYLMTAGPTPLPPRVSQVMAEPILYHRAPAFIELYARVLERLQAVFRTGTRCCCSPPPAPARWSPPSRTSCARATASVACAGGKFGERWVELGDAYGAEMVKLETGWGDRIDPAEVERCSARTPRSTSCSPRSPRPPQGSSTTCSALAQVAQEHSAVIVVDAVSGLGAADVRQDEWGVDVVVSGSRRR